MLKDGIVLRVTCGQRKILSNFYIDIFFQFVIILISFDIQILFRGGAAVAQLAVNQLVVGSNPTLGA
jgi:hypothetical protein